MGAFVTWSAPSAGRWGDPSCGNWGAPDGIECTDTIIALFGQSNALGYASSTPVPSGTVDGELWVNGVEASSYGPTNVSIETRLAPNRRIVKRAVGGSTVAEWNSTYLAQIISDASTADLNPSVCVFIQGEADTQSEAEANDWATDTATLFASCISSWGPQIFIVPKLSGLPAGGYPEMDLWNTNLVTFAAGRSDTLLVETSDLDKLGDNVHYSRTGYNDLGDRILGMLTARRL